MTGGRSLNFSQKKCRAVAEDTLFSAAVDTRQIVTRRRLIFSGCSCAPCKRFLRSNVAYLMHGEKDQSWKNEKRKRSSWTFSCDLSLLKIGLEVEVQSRRWECTDYRSLSTGHAHCEIIAWVQLTVWIYRPDVHEIVMNSKCSNIQKSFQRRRDKHEDLPCRAIKALIIAKSSGIMHDR